MRPTNLKLDDIRIDGDTQPRVAIDQQAVDDYATDITAGQKLPPVEVIHDGADYWLVDGFHRYHSHRKAGKKTIAALVRSGTIEDARWASLAANRSHGLRRSNADKAKAVQRALATHPELSDRAIAEHVGVSNDMVSRYRREVSSDDTSTAPETPREETRKGRDGKSYPAPKPQPAPNRDDLPPAFSLVAVVDEDDNQDDDDALPGAGAVPTTPSNDLPPIPSAEAPAQPESEIPERLRPIFDRRSELVALASSVSSIKASVLRAVKEKDPLYANLRVTTFEADATNLYRDIRAAMPHTVCVYCGGDGCTGCFNNGWQTEAQLHAAPEDLRR